MAIGSTHGWGVCGKYIARELAKLEPTRIIGETPEMGSVGDVLEYHELKDLARRQGDAIFPTNVHGVCAVDGPLLQGIGGETLLPRNRKVRGKTNIGYIFIERNFLQPAWVENGRHFFDRVVAGSTWCQGVLAGAGLKDVQTVVQGVDPTLFYPATGPEGRREFLADRFAVFSGGKFELRKGQDVVIRAYKVLQDRHSDVVLINAWYNPWPAAFETMRQSKLIHFSSQKGSCEQAINQILTDNGVDVERVITCPRQLNFTMGRLYRNTDVGLFPNRCEGGTNLVLMEYMACGKPVLAVDTTGHRDIVKHSNALVIESRGETTVHDDDGNPIGRWPEPDLDDVVDKLEWAYQNRGKMDDLGKQAGRDLRD